MNDNTLLQFYNDTTWVAPAGITQVTVRTLKYSMPITYEDNRSAFPGFTDENSNLFAMGLNANGQIGDGSVTKRSSPVGVLGGIAFEEVRSQPTSVLGRDTSGNLYAWGANANGQLGVGDVTPRSSPVVVLGSFRWKKHFSMDGINSFGITRDGRLFAWGNNQNGYLGVGDVVPRSSPVLVLSPSGSTLLWNAVFPGQGTNIDTIGLTTTGVAYAWGADTDGALGTGDVTPRSSPVAVVGGLTFRDIYNLNIVVYGITTGGDMYSWGNGTSGYLGNNTNNKVSSPVLVAGGYKYTNFRNCVGSMAISIDGNTYAWGGNASGQLGVGDVTGRSSPVAVLGGHKFRKIVYDASSCFGLDYNGNLFAWGLNANGQLGVGDVVPRSSPVAVLGGLTWLDIAYPSASGVNFTYGIAANGSMYAWGQNTNGELGLGDLTPRSSPVLVVGNRLSGIFTTTAQIMIPVTPGVSYQITMLPYFASFGSTVLGSDSVDILEVTY